MFEDVTLSLSQGGNWIKLFVRTERTGGGGVC